MKQIHLMYSEHRHHVLGALALAVAIFLALFLAQNMGIGGINLNPWLLGIGLVMAEFGRSFTCFGAKLKSVRMEYGGIFIQGLAWWVWSLNFGFLGDKSGLSWFFHLVVPALLLGALPMVAHYIRKQLIDENDTTANSRDA